MIHFRTLAAALLAVLAWQAPAIAESQAEASTEGEASTEIVEMALGNPEASVTLIEYASFTCSHCANFHGNQFKKLKAEYIDTGKIHFIYRDVYFDRIGLWAAMLARCESPRFFGVSGLLYEKQGEWLNSRDPVQIADNLRKLGKVAGLADDRIEACLSDADKATALVAWFEENREADGIDSTPSLVINGTKYTNMAYSDLKALIDKELGAE